MIDPKRIKHSGLKRLFMKGDPSKIDARWVPKAKRILAALNAAVSPDELRVPGFGFHALTGDRRGTYSVRVDKNWRVTFKWDDDGPYDVRLEDYHGK